MKKIILAILLISSVSVFAKNITKKILINGNCEMCEERIENALDIPGVSFADWDKETKMLTVRFNDKKISEKEIHSIISNTGYATDMVSANKSVQSKLPGCCQPKPAKKACCAGGQSSCDKK